jgi:hypothetical protein
VIEIADSTLKYDQEIKLSLYAEAGISDYWTFNLVENHLEAYSEPYQELQGKFGYSLKRIILPTKEITLPCFLIYHSIYLRFSWYHVMKKSMSNPLKFLFHASKFISRTSAFNWCIALALPSVCLGKVSKGID